MSVWVTKLRKSAEQKLRVRGGFRQESAGADEREAIDLARRLRDGHTGHYYYGADQGDEITPFHERLRNNHTVAMLAGYCIGRRKIARGGSAFVKYATSETGQTLPNPAFRPISGLPRSTDIYRQASIQDRDGAPYVLASIRSRYPWLRHIFADGGYAGDKLRKL
jgi:hypothetical protein